MTHYKLVFSPNAGRVHVYEDDGLRNLTLGEVRRLIGDLVPREEGERLFEKLESTGEITFDSSDSL